MQKRCTSQLKFPRYRNCYLNFCDNQGNKAMEYAKRNAKGLSEKMFGRLHQNEKSEIKIKVFNCATTNPNVG
jgi:hypothetical protein